MGTWPRGGRFTPSPWGVGALASLTEEGCRVGEAGGQGPGDKEKEGLRKMRKKPS